MKAPNVKPQRIRAPLARGPLEAHITPYFFFVPGFS